MKWPEALVQIAGILLPFLILYLLLKYGRD